MFLQTILVNVITASVANCFTEILMADFLEGNLLEIFHNMVQKIVQKILEACFLHK